MHSRTLISVLSVLALATMPACGDASEASEAAKPSAPKSIETVTDSLRLTARPSAALADATTLIEEMTAQLKLVVDRASAVQARQAIEVQLRLLRQKLPKDGDFEAPAETVFASLLKGKETIVQALLAQVDAVDKNPEFRGILGSYLQAMRDILK